MADRNDFVMVRGKVEAVRDGAVLFSVGAMVSRAAWIPRSLVHADDNKRLDDIMADMRAQLRPHPVEFSLRIQRWKADDAGFDGEDDQTADLFQKDPQ